MTLKIFRILAASIVAVLSACSHNPPVNYAPIAKIAIVPILEPAGYSLENKNLPFAATGLPGMLGFDAIEHSKSGQFTAAMIRQHPKPGSKLVTRLVAELTRRGYEVEVLDKVKRTADDPEDIDYSTIKTGADAILHVRFTATGVYSGTFDGSYVPRLNIRGVLYAPNREESVYDEDLYYGVDAKAGKTWGIVADGKYAYRDFDTLLAGVPDLISAFDGGSEALAERMAEHIKDTVK
jgi:hypothetical protein